MTSIEQIKGQFNIIDGSRGNFLQFTPLDFPTEDLLDTRNLRAFAHDQRVLLMPKTVSAGYEASKRELFGSLEVHTIIYMQPVSIGDTEKLFGRLDINWEHDGFTRPYYNINFRRCGEEYLLEWHVSAHRQTNKGSQRGNVNTIVQHQARPGGILAFLESQPHLTQAVDFLIVPLHNLLLS